MAKSNSEYQTAEDDCEMQPKYTENKTSLLRRKLIQYDAAVYMIGIKVCRFTSGGESRYIQHGTKSQC